MSEPILVIMAAGLGSRYGGRKQLDPVVSQGPLLLEYSLYDALEAGFRRVVLVTQGAMEPALQRALGNRLARQVQIQYAHQQVDVLPPEVRVPPGRVAPWGMGHGLLCAWEFLDAPFGVIGAHRYYGRQALGLLYRHLKEEAGREGGRHCTVAHLLENTLSGQGPADRELCITDTTGLLREVVSYPGVQRRGGVEQYSPGGEDSWVTIPRGHLAAMDCWGFAPSFMSQVARQFMDFMAQEVPQNPLQAELHLSGVVNAALARGDCAIQVLPTPDRCWDLTYPQDKGAAAQALTQLHQAGAYPQPLWASRF